MTETLNIDGLPTPLPVRRDARARRFKLRVDRATGEASLTAPRKADPAQARSFVEANLSWLQEQMAAAPEPQPFVVGARIPVRGVPHEIARTSERRTVSASEGRLLVPDLAVYPAGSDLERLETARAVEVWLKDACIADLEIACAYYAGRLRRRYRRISLRDGRTRWGSCSSAGGLSFSWRLILSPPAVLRYVAAHEVAHLMVMNHSQQFWDVVEQLEPDYALPREWLRVHGPDLHRYGRWE